MIPLGFNRNTIEGAEALAAASNLFAPKVIQRSPRAADMPPDPAPVFRNDPRFPSRIVNEVHQQLKQQGSASGGATGNNPPDFPYEVRTQAGENIIPTGLSADNAVAIVDDALSNTPVSPVVIPTRGSEYENRGMAIGEASNPSRNLSDEQRAAIDDKQRMFNAEYRHPAANEIDDLKIANYLFDKSKNVLGTADLTSEARAMEGANLIAQERKARELQSVINNIESKFGTGKPGIPYQAPVVEKQIPLSASMSEDDYYDLMYQNKVQQEPYGLPPVDRNPYADQIKVMQDNQSSNKPNQLLNKTLATGAAVGGGLGAIALINNALGGGNSSAGDVVVTSAPTPRAHFVIDKATNTAQSFIDRGDGQLQPYKTMDVQGARDAWTKAKQAGWSTSFV